MVPATLAAPIGASSTTADGVTIGDVITAVMDERGCRADVAREMACWVKEVVVYEINEAGSYHPTTTEMAGPAYRLFHDVVPHGGPPTMAGGVLVDYALGSNRGERTLIHDGPGHASGLTGCKVMIEEQQQ